MSGDAFVQFVVDELAPKAVFVGDDFVLVRIGQVGLMR